jgi:hypothetical protein
MAMTELSDQLQGTLGAAYSLERGAADRPQRAEELTDALDSVVARAGWSHDRVRRAASEAPAAHASR